MIRGPFLVTPNAPTLESVRALLQHSRPAGVHGRVSKSLGEIEGHLELHPESWGKYLQKIQQFQTTVYFKVHDEIAVKYAVHDVQSKVFVMQMTFLPTHPLAATH